MLSVKHRFHGHGSLRYVYKHGQSVHSHALKVKYVANKQRQEPRFSVVVSKKVHKAAVGRNRIRRRIYEIIRHELPQLKSARDVVIIVYSSELLAMPTDELTSLIGQVFHQADLYK